MAIATFTVRGMSCGHCVTAVSAELLQVPGVERVEVDLAAGQVTVEAAGPVSATAVTAAIGEAGYEVAPLTVAAKLGLYAAGLLAVFGIGAGIGTTLGPEPTRDHAPVTVVEHPPAHDGVHS